MLRDRIGDVLAKQKKNEDINDWLLQLAKVYHNVVFVYLFVTKMVSNNQETL